MNLPNKLTVLRVILVPFYVYFMLADRTNTMYYWISLAIFCIASITDFLDGQIARRRNLVTNFGKFMDPIADKLLVSGALICFVEIGVLPSWLVLIIISREFIINGFRLIASDKGVVIAANWWGKTKTVSQIILIIYLMVLLGLGIDNKWVGWSLVNSAENGLGTLSVISVIGTIIAWISTILTVVSLIDYIVKNKDVMKDE